MRLEDIAQFGYFLVDRDGEREVFSGPVVRGKYGEAMGIPSTLAEIGEKLFEPLHRDRTLGFVNHLDILSATHLLLTTGGTNILKHTGPCGGAYGFGPGKEDEEYAAASSVNEVARFGGIIGVPRVTLASATEMVGKTGKRLQDAVVAIEFEEGAIGKLLSAHKPPLVYRLTNPNFDIHPIDIQPGINGWVLQERIPPPIREELLLPKEVNPRLAGKAHIEITDKMRDDLVYGFKMVGARHSNAICFVEPRESGAVAVGLSGGASDRITAAYQAMENAVAYYLIKYLSVPKRKIPDKIPVTLYMVSDGFFPDAAALRVATDKHEILKVKQRTACMPYQTQGLELLDKTGSIATLLEQEYWSKRVPQRLIRKLKYIAKRLDIQVPVVLNPGKPKVDDDLKVYEFADEAKVTMLTPMRNGQHMRNFKHGSLPAYLVRVA